MDITDYVYSILREKDIVLLNAYPGFGKSRIAVAVAKRWVDDGGQVLIITRSRAEALQLCEFARQVGIRDRASLFLGRELMCPFSARNSKQCLLYRLSGKCRVWKTEVTAPIMTCNPLDLFNDGLCPYEVNEALAHQLPIVISTHAYLSSPELYGKVMSIINTWDKPLVIIDEFHNVAAGLEESIGINLDELRQWALHGNDIASKLLDRVSNYVPQREVVVLRRFDIDDLLKGSELINDKVIEILTHFGNDLCAFTYDGKLVRLRCLSLKPIHDLIMKSQKALLLTASISKRFSYIMSIYSKPSYYVAVDSLPMEYRENLTIISIVDVEFTHRNRLLREYLEIVNRSIKAFIDSSPPTGGLAIFFPSIEYLSTYVSKYAPPVWGVPTFVLRDSSEAVNAIGAFKENARVTKSLIITYAQNPIGEGVNFLEQELVGVMIIGFPLPQYSQWSFLKSRYYGRLGINGFTTTYLFPAVSTTTQIIGRLLRDLDRHRKVAVLLDGRFYRYRRYMPKWLVSRMKPLRLSQFLNASLWK
ncbi:hypothetical protein JCM16161A_23870 [Vulcanisaeta sp. JCM 16161]|uniref:helicase C-terminal domain-containing protein n=1 Tax=Vulcanisaeta sp. JCM 16161 TaxID=1295372 RepID=UPI0006D0DEB1|nr:helicase C-terminal domain-containing protein [Vulcanisaeta sp. JCM 16161]